MAGTLTISTLSDGTNSTSSTNCIQGSAKAWVSFSGATGTILGSYNTSSITRITTGRYAINMSNALANTNYSAVATASASSGTWVFAVTDTIGLYGATARTTTSFNLGTLAINASDWFDSIRVNVAVFSN